MADKQKENSTTNNQLPPAVALLKRYIAEEPKRILTEEQLRIVEEERSKHLAGLAPALPWEQVHQDIIKRNTKF